MLLVTCGLKLHTCHEGKAHLKSLFLAFIDEHEKQLLIKKTVERWSGPIKK